MAVLGEVLWLARLVGERAVRRRGRYGRIGTGTATPQERRELARAMRRLPVHYADRIGPRLQRKITEAAAAGQWEWAVDRLVTALRSRSAPVSAEERAELRSVLTALHMPADRVDALAVHSQDRTAGSAARPMRMSAT